MPLQKIRRPRRRPCRVSKEFLAEDANRNCGTIRAHKFKGQISASLTSLSRTIDDYSETAKKELISTKQEKAYERIKNFRAELLDYRQTFKHLKKDRKESVRVLLLSTVPLAFTM